MASCFPSVRKLARCKKKAADTTKYLQFDSLERIARSDRSVAKLGRLLQNLPHFPR
jgi:hypothetical protein